MKVHIQCDLHKFALELIHTMDKGKIDRGVNIEEMILRFPDFGDLLTELIMQQNSHKTKKIVNRKKRK